MISHHITRNIFYTIVFNSDTKSAFNAAQFLQIDPRCTKMIISLPRGECLFRQDSYSSAMWCQIDFVQPARNIGTMNYDTHSFVPPISAEETNIIIKQLYNTVGKHNAEIVEAKQSEHEKIAIKLIQLWAERPFTPVARLFDTLGKFHYTTQIEIRKFIEQKKWGKFDEARIGRTTMLLMQLSEKGYSLLQLPMPTGNKGKGGIIHRHYAMWIKSYFENRGHKAYLEWIVPGTNHPVDVAVQIGNNVECIEICVSAVDNLVTHVDVLEKNPNIKNLTVITGTKAELAEIRKFIKSNLLLARFEHLISLNVIENYMERDDK